MTSPNISKLTQQRCDLIDVDGQQFRDLDHDGVLAPFEDWRLPAAERVADLVNRMTLVEKVGALLHGSAPAIGPMGMIGVGTEYDTAGIKNLVKERAVNALITRLRGGAADLAAQNNLVQDVAATSRLGIPVTVSSDPRHHFDEVLGASVASSDFTRWPETLGLAATRDAELVRRFGDCVRREYRAVGIHLSLAPQADLATNPRWPRISGTFGENPDLVRSLVGAYVEGVQGGSDGLGAESVACVVKHWVGYGASADGFDGHNHYGKYCAFPSDALADHVDAFRDAFDTHVAGVMPTYTILQGVEIDGSPLEPVGGGFNEQLLSGVLRKDLAFGGFVLSDWAITSDATESTLTGVPAQTPADIAMPWGVEDMARPERFAKALNAGVDQFGGEDDPGALLEAVRLGLVEESRIDEAARRVLVHKFELGLFENPWVDVDGASKAVGTESSRVDADEAQRRGLTVLTNGATGPIGTDDVVFVEGSLANELTARGITTTLDVTTATRAVMRTTTPHQVLHPEFFFGGRQHEGDLDFKSEDSEWQRLEAIMSAVPTTVVVGMDRPAIVTPLIETAEGVFVEFGISESVLADVLVGTSTAEGRLPFRLMRSMSDVMEMPCDRPAPTPGPLFDFGAGLTS